MLVQPGEPTEADATVQATPAMFNALLDDPVGLEAAMADGTVVATGDVAALRRLLHAVTNSASTSS